MRSTKVLLFTSAWALAFALSGTMAAQNHKTSLDGGVRMLNACTNNQTIVNAPGFTEVALHQSGTKTSVHVWFHNDGTDETSGNPYRLNLEANRQLDGPAACYTEGSQINSLACYDLPYHSVWVAQGGGSNFTMDGTLRVVTQNGVPVTSFLLSWNLACIQQ